MPGIRDIGTFSVGRLGYGLMNLTWKPTQTPDEQAFEAIKTAVDGGSNMLNSGEFYGQPDPTLNLQLLSRFYAKYPSYASKTFLSVKGGLRGFMPDASEANLRKSVTNINALLGGHKKMDLFEMARVDRSVSIEETMRTLVKLRDEGHFQHIGLSEVGAETIRRASKVTKIAAVEVEHSLWSLDIEKNGVLATCKELSIPIVAYSPLGRGFLTGQVRRIEDIEEGDMRRDYDRFKPEHIAQNLQLVETLTAIADQKGITLVQLSLAFLLNQWDGIIPIPGSTRPEGVKEAIQALDVRLSEEDMQEIRRAIENANIAGGRWHKWGKESLEG